MLITRLINSSDKLLLGPNFVCDTDNKIKSMCLIINQI